MIELSEDCFNDHCRDCAWAGCGCRCHEDQDFDWIAGWHDADDDSYLFQDES